MDPGAADWPAPPDMESLAAIDPYVRSLTANQVDLALPAIDMAHWLASVLWPATRGGVPELPRLDTEQCHDRTSDAPALAGEWCAQTTVALSDIRNFRLIFAVAAAVPGAGAGTPGWILTPPSIRQIRLSEKLPDGNWDSFDVPSLLDLEASLDIPQKHWPKVDLQAAVESTQLRALPGDVVTFNVRIRNAGKRDLERASRRGADPALDRGEAKVPLVPEHPRRSHGERHVRSDHGGKGQESVTVTAYPFEPLAIEPNPDDNTALAWIFPATDPPDAVTPPKVSNPAGIPRQDK